MKKSLFILSAFICLVIFNCKNKENPEPETEPNYASIDVVTGLDLFDENGSPIGRWKFPNQKPGNGSTFPNPSTGIVSIYNTQKIERKNLNLRTWIKRLTRKTICFSKLELMHDTVIGLLINKVEFNRDIHAKMQV